MNVMQIMAAPEMTRTNPAHSGTAPIANLAAGKKQETPAEPRKLGAFETYLIEAVNGVNNQQLEVGRVQEKLITDPDSVDVHDVTTAMAKAQMSLSLAQTVIDRILTGWSEIQTTR